ncbi:hypothetical protein KKB83_03115 [Patescibacteria group bacterium]|nr:hypothetical protein [Patescibacteria group bacterium]
MEASNKITKSDGTKKENQAIKPNHQNLEKQILFNRLLANYSLLHGLKCWFCRSDLPKDITLNNYCLSFPLHKKIETHKEGPKRVWKWKEITVPILACNKCRKRFLGYGLVTKLISIGTVIIIFYISVEIHELVSESIGLLFLLFCMLFMAVFKQLFIVVYTSIIQHGFARKITDYPQIKELLNEGWELSYEAL